jgi:hypothetical protein
MHKARFPMKLKLARLGGRFAFKGLGRLQLTLEKGMGLAGSVFIMSYGNLLILSKAPPTLIAVEKPKKLVQSATYRIGPDILINSVTGTANDRQ